MLVSDRMIFEFTETRYFGGLRKAIALVGIVMALAGCSGVYDGLESAYPPASTEYRTGYTSEEVSLTSRKMDVGNAEHIRVILAQGKDLILVPRGISLLTHHAISIPAGDVIACGFVCFGASGTDMTLHVATERTTIGVPYADEVAEWCWSTRRPLLSVRERRNLEASEATPSFGDSRSEFISEGEYLNRAKSACVGE